MEFRNEPHRLETSDSCYGCKKEGYCKIKLGEMCPGSVHEIEEDERKTPIEE